MDASALALVSARGERGEGMVCNWLKHRSVLYRFAFQGSYQCVYKENEKILKKRQHQQNVMRANGSRCAEHHESRPECLTTSM